MSPTTQLLRGTLHVLILKTLAAEPLHGYAIASRIAEATDRAFELDDGGLYQALHRMEERGWLASSWGHAENGRRARFYRLTADGERRLEVETASWLRYAEAVFKVLQPSAA
ncbi:MAG TPA: PadR family transcriptional regulator [Thermoanaerobaculia bacterium]|nr:PadR family transcriptional regulator [Thermoanaerobaculia bacterium]